MAMDRAGGRPYFRMRMEPLEVERSMSGPPLPMLPSMLCLEISPRRRISKSVVMFELLVWAESAR